MEPESGVFMFALQDLEWFITGLEVWQSDYEGATDEPWEQIAEARQRCQLALDTAIEVASDE